MNQIENLNDNWRLKLSQNISENIPAQVPGCIHLDLIAAGLIDDITINGSEIDQNWIGRTGSCFATSLKKRPLNRNYYIKFNGLDTLATIKINKLIRLNTKNMHRSYFLDVTHEITRDDLLLEIEFDAPLIDAENQAKQLGLYPRPYNMPYNYQRKMACSYGWDWGPTTISSGIWKQVELISFEKCAVNRLSAITEVINGKGQIRIQVDLFGNRSDIQFRYVVKNDNVIIAETITDSPEQSFYNLEIELWHPKGMGEQKLYRIEVQLIDDGNVIEECYKTIGFRTIELDTSQIEQNKYLFAIKVNGERLYIKGANWIPDDPFPTRITRARYEKRIADMLEANINGIRVWGGGIYESEDFYEICDREGIVVWQDFLFACAAYPETYEMFEEIDFEVEESVRRLGSHPSLVIWCGGNECIEGYQYWDWKPQLDGKPWGESFYKVTIPNRLKEWDITRPYIPGSPFSTNSDDVRSFESGTNHIWDVWNELGYEGYEQYQPAFAAEFGYNGPGSWSMLTEAINSKDLDSDDLKLHEHQKAFDGMAKLAAGLKREFAKPPTTGHSWYFAAALVQARAVEVGLKHFRSLYETCSGTILWQFNDIWPAISWSVLDHTGFRKLAWHAMKSAYKPRSLSIGRVDQGAELAVINDFHEAWNTKISVSLIDSMGTIVESQLLEFSLNPFSVKRRNLVEVFPAINDGNFEGFIHAENSDISAARRTTLKPAVKAPKQLINTKVITFADNLIIEARAETYIHELCVLPELFGLGVNSSDQLLSLLPGQQARFEISGPSNILIKIKDRLDELFWSHNKLVNI